MNRPVRRKNHQLLLPRRSSLNMCVMRREIQNFQTSKRIRIQCRLRQCYFERQTLTKIFPKHIKANRSTINSPNSVLLFRLLVTITSTKTISVITIFYNVNFFVHIFSKNCNFSFFKAFEQNIEFLMTLRLVSYKY